MIKINLQFFGGRGARSGGGRYGGGGAGHAVSTTSLISERERQQALVDETLQVFSDFNDEYGTQVTDIELATMDAAGMSTMAYYDMAGNIAFNQAYFDSATMDKAYARCVSDGFHPSNGNKTALQAVAAHELGHKLTADVATKMGMSSTDLDRAATGIVKEAMKSTKHRGVVQMASKISKYATHSNAEAIAEAVSDVYCNGKKARSESRAIVSVVNKYLKGSK